MLGGCSLNEGTNNLQGKNWLFVLCIWGRLVFTCMIAKVEEADAANARQCAVLPGYPTNALYLLSVQSDESGV